MYVLYVCCAVCVCLYVMWVGCVCVCGMLYMGMCFGVCVVWHGVLGTVSKFDKLSILLLAKTISKILEIFY